MKRGEVWWARVDERCPVVLLSPDGADKVRAIMIVAPARTNIDGLAVEIAIRMGTPNKREKRVLVPILRIDLRRDLLGEDVERRHGHDQPVEFAAIDTVDKRRAFDKIVAGKRKEPALRLAADVVARTADPLHEGGDRAGRAELTHKVDVADIDAELE